MSDTPRLNAEQRYEAEVLLERILGDEDEARHFVFETLYVRAKLERERDEARICYAGLRQQFDDNLGCLAAAEKDAERYRWLRNRHYKGGMLGVWRETKEGVAIVDGWLSGADLDKAIDGAMKEERK